MIKTLAATGIPPVVGEIRFPTNQLFDLEGFTGSILTWFLGFAGAFAVLAVVYAGFMYITSAGNSDQAEKAKKNLTWAIIGVILVALSSFIVFLVQDVLTNPPH
jgi:amino acid transporter